MYFTGIDMGSTCTKLIVLDEGGAIAYKKVVPTGWNCVETAKGLIDELAKEGFARENMLIVSTGYGRQAIPFADKKVTEISCHGKGAYYLFNNDAFTLIDIGGQDTKIIETERGTVRNFIMNDKCSAGTGRFLEIMAGVLGVGLNEMCELGRESKNHVSISSMCTVFAESEVVSLIGRGTDKADIAYGIVESIATKVKGQMGQLGAGGRVYLTGGLCETPFVIDMLSQKLGTEVISAPLARYAGAIGAAMFARVIFVKKLDSVKQ